MYPTPFQVVHRTQPVTGENAHGQPTVGDYQNRVRDVYGWETKATIGSMGLGGQTDAALSNRAEMQLSLLTPDGDWSNGDLVTVPDVGRVDDTPVDDVSGHLYQINGDPEDFNHGPFGFMPGYRVTLCRVTDA